MEFENLTEPSSINLGQSVDDRGKLIYGNEVNLAFFRRFYSIQNHVVNFKRAWHGHINECKLFIPVKGTFLIAAARMDSSTTPTREQEVFKKVISAENPTAVFIPKGYANGSMNLTADAQLMVFSNSTLEESLNDDYRFPYDYWNPWEIEYR